MKLLDKVLTWARTKSPWIIHFNSGACNACDIEIVAALTPRYDVERFGVLSVIGAPSRWVRPHRNQREGR